MGRVPRWVWPSKPRPETLAVELADIYHLRISSIQLMLYEW
jgi:hypothetical protein